MYSLNKNIFVRNEKALTCSKSPERNLGVTYRTLIYMSVS